MILSTIIIQDVDGFLLGHMMFPGQHLADGTCASRLGLRAPRGPQGPDPNRSCDENCDESFDVEDEKRGDIMGISWDSGISKQQGWIWVCLKMKYTHTLNRTC